MCNNMVFRFFFLFQLFLFQFYLNRIRKPLLLYICKEECRIIAFACS